MVEVRSGYTATLLLDGTVLVAGGYSSPIGSAPTPLASVELYDPDSGTWTATGSMIEARGGHTATLLPDGKVLVAGGGIGFDGGGVNLLASSELYDPASGSWTATESMIEARMIHTATLLPDGTVLVAGGDALIGAARGPVASAELYDPGNGTWTATENMDGVRSYHTATLLPDGTVLVAGGYSNPRDMHALASAELYDPRSGSWTATGTNMIEARMFHTATLLPDGKMLVVGGFNSGEWLASAELYDPGSGN